jgi:hypothetical protein
VTYTSRDHTIDLQEISTRNQNARHIIAGFSLALPSLTEIWHYLDQALTDAVPLTGEIIWQRAEIREIRLDRANLIAAMRATLGAHHAGERDPLWYLRDELQARGLDDPGTRGRR